MIFVTSAEMGFHMLLVPFRTPFYVQKSCPDQMNKNVKISDNQPHITSVKLHFLVPQKNFSIVVCFLCHRLLQIIQSLDEDPAAQNKQLTLRLQQIAAALENKVTDL